MAITHYAVVKMKNGESLYYRRDTAESYATLADDYRMQRSAYIGLHRDLDSMMKGCPESHFVTNFLNVDYLEFIGVFVNRQSEGQPHFAEFRL
ncbi:hypothetical protein ACK8P5_26420 (plasmid) [Paenibacillus sp. EC2-1]|uniref:hypothetical protein n=1 Tax=Paenibacillus sp. EC2-1 TaxID=3388665 RepID=UPI003BEF2ED1